MLELWVQEFSNGGKLGGVTDVELGDGITQTGRVVRWLFESGMARFIKSCDI